MENVIISEDKDVKNYISKALIQGAQARVKHTGQIVDLIRVSSHGISVVSYRSGGEYFISNKYLEPITIVH